MLNVQQNIYARVEFLNKAYFSLISKDGSYIFFAETHQVSALSGYILYIVFFTFSIIGDVSKGLSKTILSGILNYKCLFSVNNIEES